jgi:flagellar hook-associated protein 2
MVALSGLSSGLDTEGMIAQLVGIERRRIDSVVARATAQTSAISAWGAIRAQVTSLKSSVASLVKATDWNLLTATSSNEAAVSVTAGSGTFTGSMAFRVTALAAAGAVRSANTIVGQSTRVTTGTSMFVAGGAKAIGFATLTAADAVAAGNHTIQVTQSSGGATKLGTGALAVSTVVDGTNNQLQLTVNGSAATITIANGTYDRTQLVAAVQAALDAQGVGVTASLDAANALKLVTKSEGSAATLRITGGSATTPLLLTTDASNLTGVDGKLKVNGGAEQTFGNTTALAAGGSLTITATGGDITATLAGGLRTGSVIGNQVSTGDGSLSSVVAAINNAKAGVTAAAVQVGTNTYRLQIAATTPGANSDPNVGLAEFDSAVIGSLVTLTQGSDAQLTVGSGAGQYTVQSSSNTIANLLPGLTVTLKQTTPSDVIVTVDRNAEALADKVAKLVETANQRRTEIDKATAYDAATKKASPLTGDSAARRLVSDLTSALINAVPGATPASPGLAGVSVGKDGKFSFDRTKFIDTFRKDPAGMAKVFAQSATATNGALSLVAAGDRTIAGTYAVSITTAAEQATLVSSGLPAVGTTIRAKIGTIEASYTVQTGDTLATTAAGLNAALAAKNLAVSSAVDGANLRVTAAAYGAGTTLSVAWDGTNFVSDAGVNVAGTIGGKAAIGTGQLLSVAITDLTLGGLSIQYTGTATGAVGSLTYTPGVAQRVSSAAFKATDSISGYLTSAENARKTQRDLINKQVDAMEARLRTYEARLRRQFATLETALANLQSQQSWLAGQIAQLG